MNPSAALLPEAKNSAHARCLSPAKTPTPLRRQRHFWNVELFEPSATLIGDAAAFRAPAANVEQGAEPENKD